MKLTQALLKKTEPEKKTEIALLALMMTADGKIDKLEKYFLRDKAVKIGLSEDDVKKIINDSLLGKFKHKVPDSTEERYILLIDLILMMMIDGHIDKKEMELCKSLCITLGFQKNIIHGMIDIIKDAKNRNLAYEECIKLLKKIN
jgi:uncharacterized tellurite resistance protein B-like protein